MDDCFIDPFLRKNYSNPKNQTIITTVYYLNTPPNEPRPNTETYIWKHWTHKHFDFIISSGFLSKLIHASTDTAEVTIFPWPGVPDAGKTTLLREAGGDGMGQMGQTGWCVTCAMG